MTHIIIDKRQLAVLRLMRIACPAALLASILLSTLNAYQWRPILFAITAVCTVVNLYLTYVQWFIFNTEEQQKWRFGKSDRASPRH
jgi:hypothetical protein